MNTILHRCEYCLSGERAGALCQRCNYDGRRRNAPPALREGTRLGDRYMLGRIVGQGGFSICYRAWDAATEEMVAIKELFPNAVSSRFPDGQVTVRREHRADFELAMTCMSREAAVLQKLHNAPAVVQVRDFFPANGTVYLSADYLRGDSYSEYLVKRFAETGQHIDTWRAVNTAIALLDVLEAVHRLDLLHLDVKPPNIRVLEDGRVVLIDFGSARDAFRKGAAPHVNLYTPGFAAIEQHDAAGQTTPATDVHGLAATLYYSLSLTVPPDAEARLRGAAIVPLSAINPAVPQSLDAIIHKALSLDATQRPATAAAFKAEIKPFGSLLMRTVGASGGRVPKPIRQVFTGELATAPMRRRVVAGLLDAAIVLIALAACLAVGLVRGDDMLVSLLLLWLAGQLLLPRAIGATLGMWMLGLRFTDGQGAGVKLPQLATRTTMLMCLGPYILPFTSDRDGLLLHDRTTNSRVVSKGR